ncbi:hypothetical protein STENM327S_06603 [Streptomyces tendae]
MRAAVTGGMVRLNGLLNGALDWPPDDPRIVEVADIMERLMIRAVQAPHGCWRYWRSGAGRAGPASSEFLPTEGAGAFR